MGERRRKALLQGWAAGYAVRRAGKKLPVSLSAAPNDVAGKLAQNKDVAYLSYKLATIKTDVELELTCEQRRCNSRLPDDELLGLFKKYEFKRWTADVESGKWLQARSAKTGGQTTETVVIDESPANRQRRFSYENYVTILDDVTLESWIEKLKKRQFFAFDTETDSLDNIAANFGGSLVAIERRLPRMYLSRMIICALGSNLPPACSGTAEAAAGR